MFASTSSSSIPSVDKLSTSIKTYGYLFSLLHMLFNPGEHRVLTGIDVPAGFDANSRFSIPDDKRAAIDHLRATFRHEVISNIPEELHSTLRTSESLKEFIEGMNTLRSDILAAARKESASLFDDVDILTWGDLNLIKDSKANRLGNPRFARLLGCGEDSGRQYPPNCPLISVEPADDDAPEFEGFMRRPILVKILKLFLHGPQFINHQNPCIQTGPRTSTPVNPHYARYDCNCGHRNSYFAQTSSSNRAVQSHTSIGH